MQEFMINEDYNSIEEDFSLFELWTLGYRLLLNYIVLYTVFYARVFSSCCIMSVLLVFLYTITEEQL